MTVANWRDNPEIMAARDYAKRFGKRRVVIYCEDGDGMVSGVSYGTSGDLCRRAGKVLDALGDYADDAFADTAPENRWG